jgi:hypothetical protein
MQLAGRSDVTDQELLDGAAWVKSRADRQRADAKEKRAEKIHDGHLTIEHKRAAKSEKA